MHQKNKDIQKRYEGFLQTNCLWENDTVYNLNQFEIQPTSTKIDVEIDDKLRLGKYIERLVSYQLTQEKSIAILCENIQIQKEKVTLGELDCIILKEKKPIHLEIIYKFYLYDPAIGDTEVAHLIGPNRKDSLIDKLKKLKEKQLPLLFTEECADYLKSINLKASDIKQEVYFKGQIFVPFSDKKIQLSTLNQACVSGFYIHRNEVLLFKECKFYIPTKKDWIVIPHKNLNWLKFEEFSLIAENYFQKKTAPLCWLKNKNGTLEKFFLIWW